MRTIMTSLKVRFAILVVLAVVFAPGSGGYEVSATPSGSDMRARMLAPTFDEAAERSIGGLHKRSERTIPVSEKLSLLPLLLTVPAFFFFLFSLRSYPPFGDRSAVRRSFISRAPPLLTV